MTTSMKILKVRLGYLLVLATILYCAGITVALIYGCEFSEMVKDIILIILTWFIAKAGTIIDFFYGTSQGSKDKDLIIAESMPPGQSFCRYNPEHESEHEPEPGGLPGVKHAIARRKEES
ncbi:MAG: hypothetical protein AB1491_00010 [Thermodesulfobacteriota bacterium]